MASDAAKTPQGETLAAISNMVVAVYADHLGRGPTKARTYNHDGVVVCLLEDSLTRAEQTLVDSGHSDYVSNLRDALQHAMHQPLVNGIEKLTNQTVDNLIAGNHIEAGISSQVFLMANETQTARGGGKPPRA
jgi:uncharacterized protein YbcI